MDEIARLIEPQIPALRRYAHALLRERDAADDLVQDTLERALSAWSHRRADGNVRAWLFAIERNLFLRAVRRRGRTGQHLGQEALDGIAAPAGDPEAQLGARDVLARLDTLPGADGHAGIRYARDGDVTAFSWAENGLAYAVTARIDEARLLTIAQSVDAQIRGSIPPVSEAFRSS